MLTSKKLIVAIIVVIFAVIAYVGYSRSVNVAVGAVSGQLIEDVMPYFRNNGGMNTSLPIQANGGLIIGSTGTQLNTIQTGTCNLSAVGGGSNITGVSAAGASLLATSTGKLYCAVSGLLSTDTVIADLPLSAASTTFPIAGGWVLTSATGSSTPGLLQVTLANFTGIATSSFAYATTGVEYIIFR